jgi:hypothetical protein
MPANKRPIAGEASSDDGTDDKNFDPATSPRAHPTLISSTPNPPKRGDKPATTPSNRTRSRRRSIGRRSGKWMSGIFSRMGAARRPGNSRSPRRNGPVPSGATGRARRFGYSPLVSRRPGNSCPSQTHPQNQSSAPLPTSAPKSLLTSVSDTPRQTRVAQLYEIPLL